ncbi:MAG: hypothetical protein M1837_002796 [Sclerophora amabilis]|nr:MAG: hypothetical protein M1837_002796 [Sclerophora amabilis]
MRSRTGCLTCKSRKIRCDEEKPTCGQCRRASRECKPGSNVVFRHQQNASMNGVEDHGSHKEDHLKGFYAYKNTFDGGSVWVEVPKHVTFINTSNPFADPLSPEPEASTASTEHQDASLAISGTEWDLADDFTPLVEGDEAPGLHMLSAAASGDHEPFLSPRIAPEPSADRTQFAFRSPEAAPHSPALASIRAEITPAGSPQRAHGSAGNNIKSILNPFTSTLPSSDPTFESQLEQRTTSIGGSNARYALAEISSDCNIETDHEIAFLLRHFSEVAGQWMDVFDLGSYFASYVPVKALSTPLLKYAAIAYAAKQLGRVKGRKATVGGAHSKQATMEIYPGSGQVDWYYKAAQYYDKAISHLMEALQDDHAVSSPGAPHQWQDPSTCEGSELERRKRRRISGNRFPSTANSDELLAGTVILCVYEFLDASGAAWSGHLSGTKSLLDIAEVGMAPLPVPLTSNPLQAHQRAQLSKARKATFWNFARQDFLAAFINECQTRLDPEDLSLWRAAGLSIDERGYVRPSNVTTSSYPEGDDVMREDMIANALVWLMSKLINYLAVGDEIYSTSALGSPAVDGDSQVGINQKTLLERWGQIEKEIETWHSGLPDTFKPCARVSRPRDDTIELGGPSEQPFSEICLTSIGGFNISKASTMQSYHMARILLLINKPHESTSRRSTITNRLSSYRAIEAEILQHSQEICGIALSRPEGSVRIHATQPLFVAGQCVTKAKERRVILDLLRGVEKDLGWATEYRVKQLLKEWGWDDNSEGKGEVDGAGRSGAIGPIPVEGTTP